MHKYSKPKWIIFPLKHLVNSALVTAVLLTSVAIADDNHLLTKQHFNTNPAWDGFHNRLLPDKLPVVKQDFGYRRSNFAGGQSPGEIGGTVQRSMTRALYAKAIPPKTMNDRLSAAGTFAVTRAGGSSGIMFGWFNENSRGWRTPNSLAFRIDGNGGKYWLFCEYGTRNWKTAGIGAYEGERYQLTPTKPFPADGTRHRWSLTYDPRAKNGNGLITFQVDDRIYHLPVAAGHKADGATFNRFGIWNVQVGGKSMDAFFDDLVVDGKRENFDRDPKWSGIGNRVEFEERIVRPMHNFGYARTNHAGGKTGEIGGIIFRDEKPAYYADRIGRLSLDDELTASGRLAFLNAGSDSAIMIGWFDSAEKRNKKKPEHQRRQKNYVGIMIEGPSRIGHYFRPGYSNSSGQGHAPTEDPATHIERPIIRPDGKAHRWTLNYSPHAAKGRGRITFTLDGRKQSLDLRPGERKRGATFDRFGLFNVQSGGHHVEIYLDDLSYTARKTN